MHPLLSPGPHGTLNTAARPASWSAALPGEGMVNRPLSIVPCEAWSRHAAELAVPLAQEVQLWPENASTDGIVAAGELARLLPGLFIPPDLLDTAVRRALALGCVLGERLRAHHVIAGPSAAWVLVGGTPPSPAELITPAHRSGIAGVVLRTSRLEADEVETIGGAPVTVPARTGVDLLRFASVWSAAPLLRRLVASGHVEVEDIRRRLHAMHRHPGVHAARERLELILGDQREASGAPEPTGLPSAVTR